MRYHSTVALLFCLSLVFNCINSHLPGTHSSRRENQNVFNVLLGLYKLNPLKDSGVYKTFSNDMLTRNFADYKHYDVNFQSNENVIQDLKTNLNEIEKVIHKVGKKPSKQLDVPEFDIDDVSTENFKVDILLNDRVISKEQIKQQFQDNIEDLSSIFGHIGSNEIDNDIPVTKLMPINDTVIQSSQLAKEAMLDVMNNKGVSDNTIGTLIEVRDQPIQEFPLVENIDTAADVIVI